MRDLPPKRLGEYRNAVVAFHNAYSKYLDAEFGNGSTSNAETLRLRNDVIEKIPVAEKALSASGVEISFTPPPMFAGSMPVMSGLANTTFLHEQPGWQVEPMAGIKPTFVGVLETVRLAVHSLEAEIEEAQRRRRNPLYWADRLLRAVLGFPIYLLGLVFRVPHERIDASWVGTVIRGIEVIGVILGIFSVGRGAGWW